MVFTSDPAHLQNFYCMTNHTPFVGIVASLGDRLCPHSSSYFPYSDWRGFVRGESQREFLLLANGTI